MGMMYSRGLVAGYPFENTANDITTLHNASAIGMAYAAGRYGQAGSFDGVDDRVQLPYSLRTALFGAGVITVSAIVQPSQALARAGIINVAGAFETSAGVYVEILNNNVIRVLARSATEAANTASVSYIFTNGQWYHIVVSCDFPNDNIKIWVDTVKVFDIGATFTQNSFSMTGSVYSTIGALGGTTYPFKGLIDSVKIYNKALTQQEIQRDYLNLPIL